MAALGAHDSGAHVAGFAPSMMPPYRAYNACGGSSYSSRRRSRRRDGYRDGVGWRGGNNRSRTRRPARSGSSETEYDDEGDTSADGGGSRFSYNDCDSEDQQGSARRGGGERAGGTKRGRSGITGGGGGGGRRGSWATPPKTRRGSGVAVGRGGSPASGRSPRRSRLREQGRRSRPFEGSEEEDDDDDEVESRRGHSRRPQRRDDVTSRSRERNRNSSGR